MFSEELKKCTVKQHRTAKLSNKQFSVFCLLQQLYFYDVVPQRVCEDFVVTLPVGVNEML